jgi:hypothetical protein
MQLVVVHSRAIHLSSLCNEQFEFESAKLEEQFGEFTLLPFEIKWLLDELS